MRRWPITGASVCLAVLALLASQAMAQPPTPTPTPAPPGPFGLSQDILEKVILVVLTAAVTWLSTKAIPWLWQRLGHLYDLVIAWAGWDPLGRFQRRYLAALPGARLSEAHRHPHRRGEPAEVRGGLRFPAHGTASPARGSPG